MKTIAIKFSKMIMIFNLILSTSQLAISNKPSSDRCLSPYFQIVSDNIATEQFPLQSTLANVKIAGVIADVCINQTYKNNGNSLIEAIYVFPASTRAAVYSMKMRIGEREIIAVIQEKKQARSNYEQAKQQGKTASLLEQERPNVFQMNIANILPGDIIKVEMKYTELLIPEDGVYEFVYPTVVGPRYSNSSEASAANDKWVSNPYTSEGIAPLNTFDIKVSLDAGIEVSGILCNTHETNINYSSPKKAEISLKTPNGNEGNRDFILQYKLKGNSINSGLLLYEGNDENFFIAMLQAPARISNENINPREYIFVVDVSGSMYGFPLEISKKLMRNLLGKLRPIDKFNILLFAGSASSLSETSIAALPENITKGIEFINQQQGGGGTEILPALTKALSYPKVEGVSRSFIIATDGYVSVEKEAFDLIRTNLGKANFFPFGIGSSVNRFIIEGIANAGNGTPFIITTPEDADATANRFQKYIETPILTDIKIKFDGFQAYDYEPANIPDLFSEKPIIICGKYKGSANGKIILEGQNNVGAYKSITEVNSFKENSDNAAIRYLWARQQIMMLDDYTKVDASNMDLVNRITQLGLKYNLLTNYTSFIAIDSEIRNTNGTSTTVNQPLPLPKGVSNYAVGSTVGVPLQMVAGYEPTKRASKDKSMAAESSADLMELEMLTVDKNEVSLTETSYTGGWSELVKFINQELLKTGKNIVKGNIFIEIDIDQNGNITALRIIKGIAKETDDEVLRIIKRTSGKWIAANENGKNISNKLKGVITIKQ